jgi:hypothetical protein
VNLDRLRWGEWIAGIFGLNLLLVTFRAWYKVTGSGVRVSAWDALDNGRYLLIATAVVGLFLLLIVAAEQAEQLSFPPGGLAALVGLGCTVYVAYRLATPPADNLDADLGLYLGLVSALGVAIGGLLSVRDASAAPVYVPPEADAAGHGAVGTPTAPLGPLVPDSGGTWSPASPSPEPNWSPAAPLPPATAAGAAVGAGSVVADRPVQAGDEVALTAGGARFPVGTIARVVEVFGGGALVEVVAADGVAERFEVPKDAYERLGAAGSGVAGSPPGAVDESWTPAMPAPAPGTTDDWGFDERAGAGGAAAGANVDEDDEPEPATGKVPWWKREIGGKKKPAGADMSPAEAGAASALAAAPIAEAAEDEERPGFFKRLFGGRKSDAAVADETSETGDDEPLDAPEAESTPASDVSGLATAAESDTDIRESAGEPEVESVVDEAPAVEAATAAEEPEPRAPEAEAAQLEPEPAATEPEAAAPEAEVAEPEPIAAAPEPEPEPEVVVTPSEPAAQEPEAATPDPESSAPDPEPEPAASVADPEPGPPAPEVVAEPEAEAAAADPEPEPEPEPPAPEPEPEAAAPEPETAADVVADAGAAEASEPDAAEAPKPKRKRSSGSRKVPKEAIAAAAGEDAPPKVGDTIELKVAGGRYDAGTRGTVVDVFSAGVIVELTGADGRSERLDLPFEAVGPAEA